jgi:hypothetical protein
MGPSRCATATGKAGGSRAISDPRPAAAAPPRNPPRRLLPRLLGRAALAVALIVAGAAAIVASDLDAYWPLDLRDEPGVLTQWRIRLLAAQPEVCLRTLARSGIGASPAAQRPRAEGCGYEDGVTLAKGALAATPVLRCSAAAAYATWERHVVQPAARRLLGAGVAEIRTFGTFACRDIAGRPGRRSQHATANAVDVSGFRLSDGRVVTVLGDWSRGGASADFLREVRDGACGLFSGVLSPDWNEAHRDHFHFDMGRVEICR